VYKGLVKNGKVVLPEGVELPEGTVVTVTIGEAELMRARLQLVLGRNFRRSKAIRRPLGASS
jgi:hypothetical protein